jgi:hypothetical protein
LKIYIQKYANFIKEVDESNELELAIDFNNIEERNFQGNYTYSMKEQV